MVRKAGESLMKREKKRQEGDESLHFCPLIYLNATACRMQVRVASFMYIGPVSNNLYWMRYKKENTWLAKNPCPTINETTTTHLLPVLQTSSPTCYSLLPPAFSRCLHAKDEHGLGVSTVRWTPQRYALCPMWWGKHLPLQSISLPSPLLRRSGDPSIRWKWGFGT